MSRFSEKMPVLYVEPPFRLRQLRRALVRNVLLGGLFRGPTITNVRSELHVLHSSPLVPVSGSRLLANMSADRWYRAVFKAASRIGIHQPIIWMSQPEQVRALSSGKYGLSIYHIVDEYTGYTGTTAKQESVLAAAEQLLLDTVDLTIAVSPELVRAKSAPGRDVFLVENAVNLREFELARSAGDVPEDLLKIPRPRIGYSGLVGKRLDLKLIQDVACKRPEWSFVMIGVEDSRDCESILSGLKDMPNVYFLGEKPPSRVASYVTGLDLGMLPYELNTETSHISPLKMYEYLAAGLPIVSTAIPASRRKANVVAIACDANEFDSRCAALLDNKNDQDISERLGEAAQSTWDNRIAELTNIICPYLSLPGDQ